MKKCAQKTIQSRPRTALGRSWAPIGVIMLFKKVLKNHCKKQRKKQYNIVLARLLGGLGRQDRPYNHCYYLLLLRKVAPSWLQDGSKMAPRWPKLAPRCPNMAPRLPKYGPKMAQDCPKLAQDGPKMVQDGPKRAQDGLKVAQDGFI